MFENADSLIGSVAAGIVGTAFLVDKFYGRYKARKNGKDGNGNIDIVKLQKNIIATVNDNCISSLTKEIQELAREQRATFKKLDELVRVDRKQDVLMADQGAKVQRNINDLTELR
ncbi:hypothetical protein LCGC14_0764620, partial [marine sediment metagenome]